MFLSLGYAEVLSFEIDAGGNPLYKVKEGSSIYDQVPSLMVGGSPDNLGFRPLSAAEDILVSPKTYVGCIAVILKPPRGVPVILGTVSTALNAQNDFSEERDYDADGQLNVSKHCVHDETSRLDGAFRAIGAQGITLDTTSNEEPIRLQVANSNHLRISQTGSLTNDHVVLASVLLSRLADLESKFSEMVTRVNTLSQVCVDAELAKVALEALSGNVHLPRITSLDPNVLGWDMGSDASYQADCVRISNKSTED